MRQNYKVFLKRYHRYIRYFIIGFILAALLFGSVAIKMAQPKISADPCEPYYIGPVCQERLPEIEVEAKGSTTGPHATVIQSVAARFFKLEFAAVMSLIKQIKAVLSASDILRPSCEHYQLSPGWYETPYFPCPDSIQDFPTRPCPLDAVE